MPNIAESRVSAADLAAVLGLTSRRVRQLADDLTFARDANGKFELGACVRAYLGARTAATSDGAAELTRQRALLAEAQRLKLEREQAVAEGQLLSAAQVVNGWQRLCGAVRARLLALPQALAQSVAAEDDAAACHELLTVAVHDALQELSEARS